MSKKEPKELPIKPMSVAIAEAKARIESERSGIVNGLYTRWAKVNRVMLKYWRFGLVTAVAGMSGSGKSAILNMIEDDFSNPDLNPFFVGKIGILAFKYEMSAADEILRTLSGKAEKSFSHLLSSEIDETKSVQEKKPIYNTVDDFEYQDLCSMLDKLQNRPIEYVENAGNLEQLWYTCIKWKEKNPNKRLIVTIDHTLLSKKLSEKDDLELASNTAQMAIRLKKTLNAMVILILQMNGEIEKANRRDNPDLHFPVKTDIHCGNQVFWACDNVFIFHRPEILHIDKYGKKPFALKTKGLIHGSAIKTRNGKTDDIFFKEEFSKGNITQIRAEDFKWGAEPMKFT